MGTAVRQRSFPDRRDRRRIGGRSAAGGQTRTRRGPPRQRTQQAGFNRMPPSYTRKWVKMAFGMSLRGSSRFLRADNNSHARQRPWTWKIQEKEVPKTLPDYKDLTKR
ncbi:hypothetical protein VUR80DRAFT_137 [Thermomyces stellatus]